MSKEKIINETMQVALLRFEVYADLQDIHGAQRSGYLNRMLRQVRTEMATCQKDTELQRYEQHQQFLYKRALGEWEKHQKTPDEPALQSASLCPVSPLFKEICRFM